MSKVVNLSRGEKMSESKETTAWGIESGGKAQSDRMLALGALGVVFGDIGTSPLYAFKQSFSDGSAVSQGLAYGVISMIFWSMIMLLSLIRAICSEE